MNQTAYIDESGNFGFRFLSPNVSTHFVVGGILVDDSDIPALNALADSISTDFFGGGEIKSSRVGPQDDRRLEVLRRLIQGNLYIYAMVFDKRKMNTRGLNQKRSFYKFLNRLAYEQLTVSFPGLRLVADEHGSKDFMESFKAYIDERLAPTNLFGEVDFGFVNSKSDRLIQLADFTIGTIARCFDHSILSPRRFEIIGLLNRSGRLLPVFEWPKRFSTFAPSEPALAPSQHDDKILNLSMRLAQKFVATNEHNRTQFVPEQVATVRILLHHARFGARTDYLYCSRIVGQLSTSPHLKISKSAFGRMIVGKLRDKDVLVTSGKRGYRLVSTVADLRQFVEFYNSFLSPMLKRLASYRSIIMFATKNSLDILSGHRYTYLRDFYHAQKRFQRRRA